MVLPLALCSPDDDSDIPNETPTQLVELTSPRSMTPHNTVKGIKGLDGEKFANVNLTLGLIAGFNVSYVFGEFGASDANEELEINMEVARKKTIDKNILDAGNIVPYMRGYAYNLLDAVMVKTDYYITKKGGGTLFITTDKKYKIENYPFKDRFDPDFAFTTAGLFTSNGNGFHDDALELLKADVYYSEDDVFSDEATNIPMRMFVDYRMLLHLRFLVRNGAKNISLKGRKEDGSEVIFSLSTNSDLVALSDEFEANNIETVIFSAKGNYRIDFFNGFVFSSEATDDNSNHSIIYKYGNPVSD